LLIPPESEEKILDREKRRLYSTILLIRKVELVMSGMIDLNQEHYQKKDVFN
jgi:hypothetical protein